MEISSAAFAGNRLIPAKYTCKGENINPPLKFKSVPSTTQSLAVLVHDPDAPAGDWLHWAVWNIDPKVTVVAEGSLPVGAVEGATDFGKPGYGGPCPHSGTHRYVFELYALDRQLSLKRGASRAEFEKAMTGHTLAKADVIGLFSA